MSSDKLSITESDEEKKVNVDLKNIVPNSSKYQDYRVCFDCHLIKTT